MHAIRIHAEHDIAVSSLLFSKNVHPRFVQELLGHASVTITLDTYAHMDMVPGTGRQTLDAIGEALE
jgi:integrase